MYFIVVTPEVSHAPMSSLKDDVVKTQSSYRDWPSIHLRRTQNNRDMSVTSPVSHVEMWPYAASAAVAFESHTLVARLNPRRSQAKGGLGSCMGSW